jgi:hypothetical protein
LKSINTLLMTLTLLSLSAPVQAQAPGSNAGDGVRFGIAVGGISTIAVSVELFRDSRSIDLSLGTWSFHDVSFSAVVKQYAFDSAARPFVGAGLWMVVASPANGRTGVAVVLRAPVGVDWEVTDGHSLGAVVNLNRGLAVRRTDPEDVLPMNKRLVPLPELYYRYTR